MARSADGVHGQAISTASFIEGLELALNNGHGPRMLDPHLPVRGLGDPAEAAPVNDEPLVDTGWAGAFHLRRSRSFRLHEPVDVLGSQSFGIVDVELAALPSLGVFPVNLLATRLDDVQIEVGVGVPDQGELRVADLDRDAPNDLASLTEPGQAEAVPCPGARVVVGQSSTGARLASGAQPERSRAEPL